MNIKLLTNEINAQINNKTNNAFNVLKYKLTPTPNSFKTSVPEENNG